LLSSPIEATTKYAEFLAPKSADGEAESHLPLILRYLAPTSTRTNWTCLTCHSRAGANCLSHTVHSSMEDWLGATWLLANSLSMHLLSRLTEMDWRGHGLPSDAASR